MTGKRLELLKFMATYSNERGRPPSRREICAAVGMTSPNGAWHHIQVLMALGAVEKIGKTARGLVLTDKGWELSGIKKNDPKYRRVPILSTTGLRRLRDRMAANQ